MSGLAIAEPEASNQDGKGMYRSGVAARLAGVPVNTLRVWERRYAVVGPRLSTGRQRLYSMADVRRLTLIKQLVDMGHPIGSIASLGEEVLTSIRTTGMSMLINPVSSGTHERKDHFRIALVGPLLIARRLEQSLGEYKLDVAGSCSEPNRATAALRGLGVDLVVIELPTLSDAEVDLVASIKLACGAPIAAVFYRYAPTAIIRRLRAAGHAVARATSDVQELQSICLGLLRSAEQSPLRTVNAPSLGAGAAPSPRFNDNDLAFLSGMQSKVACECPRHLVDLIMNLGSFERYSAQCASRNEKDIALHLALQNAAGQARGIIEQALDQLIAVESISLPREEGLG